MRAVSDESVNAAARLRIDRICLDFERQWKAGPPPRIEDFLTADDGAPDPILFQELLLLDLDYRRRSGQSPQASDYLGRFSEQQHLITAACADTTNSSLDLASPPEISGYVLGEEIGMGGMGVVYRAWHTALKRPTAIKLVRGGNRATPSERLRFRAEAEAVARLNHPNIVRIYDVGTIAGELYLALEYLPNGTLARKCSGQPLPPREAAQIIECLARAVAYAHGKSVVHRDLKPANVLMAEDGRPVIADFGLAWRADEESARTGTGQLLGTPSYLAPEQARGGDAARAPAVDIYALGAILYELLTGRPPFRGPTAIETIRQVQDHEPVAPRSLQPDVPIDLDTICLKCLAKDPARRYLSAQELADDVQRFLDGRPIVARRVGWLERSWRWGCRHPAIATLAGGLFLAIVVGLGSWYRFTRQLADAQHQAAAQRDQALKHLQSARSAVQVFLREVTNESRFKETSSPQLRQRLLQLAKKFYDEMPLGESDDPLLVREHLMTLIDLSRITELLGDSGESMNLVRRAGSLANQLVQMAGDHHADLEQVAVTRNELGLALVKRNQLDEAKVEYEAAIDLVERLLAQGGHDERMRFHLGAMYNNLGILFRAQGNLAEALRTHQQALEVRGQLPQHIGDYANGVAQSWHNLASVHQSAGRNDEALQNYLEAVRIRTELHTREPKYAEYAMSLASSLWSAGRMSQALKRSAEAADYYRKAVAVMENLNQQNPNVKAYQDRLSAIQRSLDQLASGSSTPNGK